MSMTISYHSLLIEHGELMNITLYLHYIIVNDFLQMHKKITAKSLLIGKDNFMVTVYPNIDQAFIVSLIVILDAINAAGDAAAVGASSGAAVAVAAGC